MKTFPKKFIIIFVIVIMNIQIKAQVKKIDFESLITGKSYKVKIENGWETEGKLIKKDSNSIDIKTENKTFTINKIEVEEIVSTAFNFKDNNISEPVGVSYENTAETNAVKKDKLYLSVGSGVNFTSIGFNSYNSGINLQLSLTKIISPGYAIRGDLQFGQNTKKSSGYSYGDYSSSSKGGDINNYSAMFDFLLGALRPESKINGYAIFGGGFNVLHETETKSTFTYREYNYYTNEPGPLVTNSYTDKGSSIAEMMLGLGGGLGIKISNKVRLYGEAQYSFPILFLGEYTGFYPESFLYGNPTLKIGAQIGL